MGLSCQKTQVTGWGPLFCRGQITVGTWKQGGCRCTVRTAGRGKGAHTTGVSGPASWLPSPGLCVRLYRDFGALKQRPGFFCAASFVPCNLWPQVPSLSCLQEDGQGIPSPNYCILDPLAHCQGHHRLEYKAMPARVKAQSGGLQLSVMPASGSQCHGSEPVRHKQLPSLSDFTFPSTQKR